VNILAIDSATEACSAALLREDGVVFSEFEIAPRQHNKLLPEMMEQVLAASGVAKQSITHCAFSNGPGAFTGIRIAAAQAQGIGIALGIPLLPISTLAVLAQTGLDRSTAKHILVALDARMQEIYWAIYDRDDDNRARLVGEERLSRVDDISIDNEVEYGVGHGWVEELRERVNYTVDYELLPDARAMLKLAESAVIQQLGVDATRVEINYLRNQVAEKSKI
jgi:tRNA threonylcarbamoyladenosine biosynthesis protein TsaB